MKSIITYLIPALLLSSMSVCGQMLETTNNVYTCANAAKEETAWKEESVSDRKSFYTAPAAPFDPAADYETLYTKSASAGMAPKTVTGKVKLITENNTAPVVYYNNATVGTIIKLNNPDNGKSTYAVVVGKVDPEDSHSYLLMLNEKVARNLSIKDYSSIELVCYKDTTR